VPLRRVAGRLLLRLFAQLRLLRGGDLRLPGLREELMGLPQAARRDRDLSALNKAACRGIVRIECCRLRL
jgi:hypothetical protein